jgi:3-oxoacyl-[acyl-carrier-protein] synthase-1
MSFGGAVVTGLAANTSLGGAVAACAAARGGLARPAPLDALAWDEEDGAIPVVGHPVPTVAGFQGEARLIALGLPAIEEAVRDASLPADEEVAFLLAMPDLDARAKRAGGERPVALGILERLAAASKVPVAAACRQAFLGDQTGFAAAVDAALRLLSAGTVRKCIVGAVDTFCDDLAIDALSAGQQLKTGDNPVGLQPGEAAAFLVLETSEGARRRKASVLGRIVGASSAVEPGDGDRPPVGEGMFASLRQLVETTGPLPRGETFFVLDRNGEAVRANDWGYCQQRIAAHMPEVLPAPEWDPAASFGDTGAASGALAAEIALRAFARGYAPGRCAIVVSSTGGRRAAIRVEKGT